MTEHITPDTDIQFGRPFVLVRDTDVLAALDEPKEGGPMPTPDELRARAETDMLAADTAEAIRQMDADPTHPHTGLVVQPYRDHGVEKWVFRCWGTDTCDGWLSLDHTSEQWAEQARDRHVTEEH